MVIKQYEKYIDNIENLEYFIFDVDDNLLILDTPLHFQHFEKGVWKNKNITSSDFAEIRKKYPNNYMDNIEWKADQKYTFIEFGDTGPRGSNAFLEDSIYAIKNKKFGPSWEVLISALIEGRLFAIITSRGHEPSSIRSVIEYIIKNILTANEQERMKKNIEKFNIFFNVKVKFDDIISQYLNSCYFMGITSNTFVNDFNYFPQGEKLNIGKQDAIHKFTMWVRKFAKRTKLPLSVSFSDDDINYSNAAKELFMHMEKSLDFPEMFYVFDTSNKNIKGGVQVKI
jgi:hypothetical protein